MTCLALVLLALMVQSEAGSESFEGKVAVAYVAVNRAEASARAKYYVVSQVVLGDYLVEILRAPKQFALFPRVVISESSWLAARIALGRLQPDPTHGADHFYARSVKPLPAWYDERYITARIGRHDFLNLGGF